MVRPPFYVILGAALATGCTTPEFLGVDLRAPEAAGTPMTDSSVRTVSTEVPGAGLAAGERGRMGGPVSGMRSGPVSGPRSGPRSGPLSGGGAGRMAAGPLFELVRLDVLGPSNHRDWSPDQAVLSWAEYSADGETVTIRNVRNCDYRTSDDYDVHHEDRTYDLTKLKTVDFIRVPFPERPELAHTMLSFGFDDRDYLGVSVEIRKEKGESYNPLLAGFNKYEIMYVLADERDLIGLRANYRLNEVYLYPTRATPEQVRRLFDDVMTRVNQLRTEPEFYNTITNNCTTSIIQHVNTLAPNRIPYDYRVLLPGYSDRLAYDLGLLDMTVSFEETRRRARVTDLAYRHRESPDFSRAIRQR